MTIFRGTEYKAIVGSDLDRDGMYLELAEASGQVVAEVFYSDGDGSMTFTTYCPNLPVEAAEWMIAEAKTRLAPVR